MWKEPSLTVCSSYLQRARTQTHTHTEREINPEQADSKDCDVLQIALSHPISHIKEALNRYLHSERQSMKCTKSGFSGEMARNGIYYIGVKMNLIVRIHQYVTKC